jgi:hypothetical protein
VRPLAAVLAALLLGCLPYCPDATWKLDPDTGPDCLDATTRQDFGLEGYPTVLCIWEGDGDARQIVQFEYSDGAWRYVGRKCVG